MNNDQLAEEHADMWEIDGIHLLKTFYPYWAANLMMAAYGEDLGE